MGSAPACASRCCAAAFSVMLAPQPKRLRILTTLASQCASLFVKVTASPRRESAASCCCQPRQLPASRAKLLIMIDWRAQRTAVCVMVPALCAQLNWAACPKSTRRSRHNGRVVEHRQGAWSRRVQSVDTQRCQGKTSTPRCERRIPGINCSRLGNVGCAASDESSTRHGPQA